MQQIDARGLSCPEPVLRVQTALRADASGVTALVDNMASVENIRRFAAARGYAFAAEETPEGHRLTLTKA
ncbi:MAG: sulfurtransferase TusA family protein [Clostridia bacterium]|nr:sulfurtransferase TusA family protein [Clostridia bacterium]